MRGQFVALKDSWNVFFCILFGYRPKLMAKLLRQPKTVRYILAVEEFPPRGRKRREKVAFLPRIKHASPFVFRSWSTWSGLGRTMQSPVIGCLLFLAEEKTLANNVRGRLLSRVCPQRGTQPVASKLRLPDLRHSESIALLRSPGEPTEALQFSGLSPHSKCDIDLKVVTEWGFSLRNTQHRGNPQKESFRSFFRVPYVRV